MPRFSIEESVAQAIAVRAGLVQLTILSAMATALAGCGESIAAPPDRRPVRIEFQDDSIAIAVDSTKSLVLLAWDAGGRPIESPQVTWTTSQAAVASVDTRGVVTGVSPGRAAITASVQGVSATAQVLVQRLWLTTRPSGPPMLAVGAGGLIVVDAHFDDGTGTSQNINATWSSADSGIARIVLDVSVAAYIEGVGAGVTTITARAAGLEASMQVEVFGPLPSGAAGMRLVEASMIEFTDPGFGGWEYAPKIRVEAESNSIEVVRIRGVFPSQGPWPPFCASVPIPPFGSTDLFRELFGGYELSFTARDFSRAPAGSRFLVSLDYRTGNGSRGTLALEVPIVSGTVPTTHTPGPVRWQPCSLTS